MSRRSNVIFFWGHKNGPFACFSNWYPLSFVDEHGHRFANSEVAMMRAKAKLFDDERAGAELLGVSDPKKAKAIGRRVRGFDDEIWHANARRLVVEILMLKFGQNAEARNVLLSTGDRLLAEASPYDRLWGIGLSADAAKGIPEAEWPGTNWLGEVLVHVRARLRLGATPTLAAACTAPTAPVAGPSVAPDHAAGPIAGPPGRAMQTDESQPSAGPRPEAHQEKAACASEHDGRLTHLLVLDFEATRMDGDRSFKHEIIEFPAVLLKIERDQDESAREGRYSGAETSLDVGNVAGEGSPAKARLVPVDEFRSFVRPTEVPTLSAFCTDLTSIMQAQVDDAPTLDAVFPRFERWLEGHGLWAEQVLPVTCGDWDLSKCLPAECRRKGLVAPRVLNRWCNVKTIFKEALGVRKVGGMTSMLRQLDLPLVGRHHLGIDDSRNIAAITAAIAERSGADFIRPTNR
jgi:ribA/ribD-fused uncharacterized protein